MYSRTKHRSCFSRHISTMTYSQMKRSRLRRDEDSVPANTRAKGLRLVCPMQRTRWDWNYSDRRSQGERERASSLSFPYVLSSPHFTARFFSLSSLPTAPPLPPPPPISSSPSLGPTDLLSRLIPSLSSDGKRERRILAYTRTRNKKVIGSRYKGKFFKGIFKRKLGFFDGTDRSVVFFSIETLLFYYWINRLSLLSRLSPNIHFWIVR